MTPGWKTAAIATGAVAAVGTGGYFLLRRKRVYSTAFGFEANALVNQSSTYSVLIKRPITIRSCILSASFAANQSAVPAFAEVLYYVALSATAPAGAVQVGTPGVDPTFGLRVIASTDPAGSHGSSGEAGEIAATILKSLDGYANDTGAVRGLRYPVPAGWHLNLTQGALATSQAPVDSEMQVVVSYSLP